MTTLIHTADWQIGRLFGHQRDRAKALALQQARLKAVEELGRLANASNAEAVLVCGDLFDSPLPTRSTVCQTLGLLGQIQCGVFVIPGNHDHGGPGTLWWQEFFAVERKALAPNLKVLLESEPQELDQLVLLPCPLLGRRVGNHPLAWLASPDVWGRVAKNKVRVIMAHGPVQSFLGESEAEELSHVLDLTQLPEEEVDYVALGDWHAMKQVGPRAWYAGALEPDRFPRGPGYRSGVALQVRIGGRGGEVAVEVLETGQVQWISEQMVVDEVTGVEPLKQWLESTIGTSVGRHVVRLELEGSLGCEALVKLEELLQQFEARALDLETINRVTLTPGAGDLEALTSRPGDPVIAGVARRLMQAVEGSGEEVDRSALLTLHRLMQEQEGA